MKASPLGAFGVRELGVTPGKPRSAGLRWAPANTRAGERWPRGGGGGLPSPLPPSCARAPGSRREGGRRPPAGEAPGLARRPLRPRGLWRGRVARAGEPGAAQESWLGLRAFPAGGPTRARGRGGGQTPRCARPAGSMRPLLCALAGLALLRAAGEWGRAGWDRGDGERRDGERGDLPGRGGVCEKRRERERPKEEGWRDPTPRRRERRQALQGGEVKSAGRAHIPPAPPAAFRASCIPRACGGARAGLTGRALPWKLSSGRRRPRLGPAEPAGGQAAPGERPRLHLPSGRPRALRRGRGGQCLCFQRSPLRPRAALGGGVGVREGEALRVLHRLGELHRLLLPAGQVRGRLGSHSGAMAEASPSTQASCPLRQTLAPTRRHAYQPGASAGESPK